MLACKAVHNYFCHSYTYRLNKLQVMFLTELQMKSILKALKTFISWFQIGLYDFSSFSIVLKENLSESHQNLLYTISDEAIVRG